MNHYRQRLMQDAETESISPRLLCNVNRRIGQRLGPLYDGVPGGPGSL